jgi:ribonucleoside-diphosphate reductase subunit M2
MKNEKFCLFPIQNYEIWNLYKKQIKAFWTVEEVDFSNDFNDFETLDEHKQHTIKMILAFFSNTDGLVNYNIKSNFLFDFDNEIVFTYVYQMFMEQIHNECYSLMIETLIKDDVERNDIFNSLTTIPIISRMSEFGLKYSNDFSISLSLKVLVFICFEGIMFSGAFALIYWIKSLFNGKNFMKGFIMSNEFIARDESMHVEFGVKVFEITNRVDCLSEDVIRDVIFECVELTQCFNEEVLRVRETGMNVDLMDEYTEYVADRVFVDIGLNKHYNVDNPFTFMESIGMMRKTNFHESRVSEYKTAICNGPLILDWEDF